MFMVAFICVQRGISTASLQDSAMSLDILKTRAFQDTSFLLDSAKVYASPTSRLHDWRAQQRKP